MFNMFSGGVPKNVKEFFKDLTASASEIDRASKEIPKTALNALAMAKHRRVDFVGIGDSNHIKDGFGFSGGFAEALGKRFGMYATGIGSSLTTGNERLFNIITGASSIGSPTELESIYPSNSPEQYSYFESGTFTPTASGVSIKQSSQLGTKNELKFWTCWGGFNNGSGTFRRGIRYGASPYTTLVSDSSTILTNTGDFSKNFSELILPADENRLDLTLEFKIYNQGTSGSTITAPFIEYFSRVENPNIENGISVHSLYAVGGQSLYDMASTLIGYSDAALKNFFEETRRLQLSKYQKPIIVVYINSGLNDLNETEISLGDFGVTDGNSKEAYQDNLNAVIDRIEAVYGANWDLNELYFLLHPSHPTGDSTEATLDLYRQKCKEVYFERPRCSFVNLRDIVTSDYMLEQGYYLSGGADRYHLNKDGYLDLTEKVVNTIQDV